MAESLVGTIKEIVQGMIQPSVIACTVVKENPLLLKFDGDTITELDEDCLIIPNHAKGMKRNQTAYVSPTGDGSYIVLGMEDADGA